MATKKAASTVLQNIRKIEKSIPTYNYKPKNKKKYVKPKYITNTKTPIKQQTFSLPHTKAGITSKMDKGMKYNLNMNYGDGGYNNTSKYFDRLYSVYPEKEIDNICQYVFIVRPDLNILTESDQSLVSLTKKQINSGYYPNSSPSKDQLFRYIKKNYPYMLKNLSASGFSGHDFIPYLVGRTETLQLPDYTIKDYNIAQPYTNYNLPYASHALESTTGGKFDITFREDSEYSIHKLFQTWLYYIDGVTRNRFGPRMKYIINNKIDYACSVYCITCKADGESIIYWSKYTGAFPTAVPNSDLSFNLRGTPNNKVTIPFDYFRQEPLDPYILVDFNKNAHVLKNANKVPFIPVYGSGTLKTIGMSKDPRSKVSKAMDSDNSTIFNKNNLVSLGSGNGLVGCPFICKVNNQYMLRWKKIKDLTPS